MKRLLLGLAAMLPATGALGQSDPIDPHAFTCGQMLSPADENERVGANMVMMWTVGYFYGRFAAVPESNVTAEGYDTVVTDLVAAVESICPNVPDMPMAAFAENLANDLAQSLQGAQ